MGFHRSLALVLLAALLPTGCKNERVEGYSNGEQRTPRARDVVQSWPGASRQAALEMIEKYGKPDEITGTHLVWFDNGPWAKSVVYREPVDHDFPMPHKDVLAQTIDYYVPIAMHDELADYDGSLVAHRTKGHLTSHCNSEAYNFLAINLANDIVLGDRSVEEARNFYAKELLAMMNGQGAPYTQGFVFALPRGDTTDPGQSVPPLARRPEREQAVIILREE